MFLNPSLLQILARLDGAFTAADSPARGSVDVPRAHPATPDRAATTSMPTPHADSSPLIGARHRFMRSSPIAAAIVTDNEGEFGRIEGLPCENWLREG